MNPDKKLTLKPKIKRRLDRIVSSPFGGATIWTLANSLTLFRIFVSPIFLIVYLQYATLGLSLTSLPYVLLALTGISELSDALDGWIARKYEQVTDLGKILDPMADSIYRISVFFTFTQPPINVPLVCVFIFLYRDSVISTLRTICALRGFALAARPSGKMKAIIQAVSSFAIITLLIPFSWGDLSQEALTQLATAFVLVPAFYALYSGIDYIYANRVHIQRILTPRSRHSLKMAKSVLRMDGAVLEGVRG